MPIIRQPGGWPLPNGNDFGSTIDDTMLAFADVLEHQVVTSAADAAGRDALIPSPQPSERWFVWLENPGALQRWSGTAWVWVTPVKRTVAFSTPVLAAGASATVTVPYGITMPTTTPSITVNMWQPLTWCLSSMASATQVVIKVTNTTGASVPAATNQFLTAVAW